MTQPEIEPVVAGTPAFARALAGAVLARVRVLPRVAADAAEALVFARGPRALVVVEFLGEDTLSALKDLVLEGDGVRVVAAVPPAHAAAEEPLRALGVEPVRWTGAPDPILDAVERQLAAATPPAPAAGDVRPLAARAPELVLDSPAERDAPWPAAVPGAIEAADALGRALLGDGAARPDPLSVAAAEAIASFSDLERAVVSGRRAPVDTEPVRRAAVMRVRVAAALATAPEPGDPLDTGAVSAFLADVDALLSDVNALAAGAPPDTRASLEAIRDGLVGRAIDFSEAAQRAVRAE